MDDAARDLVERHRTLARNVARRFVRGRSRWLIEDLEMEAEAALVLCEVAARFDPARNDDFTGHLCWHLRNHFVDVLRARVSACRDVRRRQPPGPLAWEALATHPGRGPDPAALAEARLDAPVYLKRMARYGRGTVERVVLGGERLTDVARELGITPQGVWKRIDRELARARAGTGTGTGILS